MTKVSPTIKTIYKGNLTWLPEQTILFVRHGSHAYGTNIETSDTDYKGVAIPPEEYFLGFNSVFEQAEGHDPDLVVYDIRKFMRLAADCNPNIVELLYADPVDVLDITSAGASLRAHRSAFLSKKAKHTFSGYAMSQLKRIKTHRRWLLSPPTEAPTRKAYNLPENQKVLSPDQQGAYDDLVGKGIIDETTMDANFLLVLEREKSYLAAKREWEQYQNWKASRNKQRAELEAKYGYDTKHAMHLVRLMRMCREILTTGEVLVKRPDAKELLEIRYGTWSYDKLMGWANDQDAELEELARVSSLPNSPDRQVLDRLCIDLVAESLTTETR